MTVMNQKARQNLRDFYKKKKYLPLDLRPKKTRAIRRRLTPVCFNAATYEPRHIDFVFTLAREVAQDTQAAQERDPLPHPEVRSQGMRSCWVSHVTQGGTGCCIEYSFPFVVCHTLPSNRYAMPPCIWILSLCRNMKIPFKIGDDSSSSPRRVNCQRACLKI